MPTFQLPKLGGDICERELRWRSYLASVANGNAVSLTRLYDESGASLLGLALKIMKNHADAEEVLLETFEQVWRTAQSFDPARGSSWRWLTVMVRSRALDRLRTSASRNDRIGVSLLETWDLASHDPLPDSNSILSQERDFVRCAVQRLPVEQRQAVELAYFSGLTHVEIASQLGVPLGTVKTRIRAAMDKLRTYLSHGQMAAVPASIQ